MQFVVIGTDEQGRSTVIEIRPVTRAAEELRGRGLWAFDQLPAALSVGPREPDENVLDVRMGPTEVRWLQVQFAPGHETGFHRTETLDFDVVIDGELTVILEEGEVLLRPGDSLLNPSALHAWRAGPDGCTLSVVLLGLEHLPR